MTRFATISRATAAATVVAVIVTLVLRALDHEAWRSALLVGLACVGVRIGVLAWGAARGESSWLRLLLPAIVLVEGVGLARGTAMVWQARLATAIALEVTFVVVAIRELRRTAVGPEPLEVRCARAFGALLPPRIARLAAFEIVIVGSALRFLLGGWRRPVPPGFTYHRESGLRMLLPMLPLLAVGDVLLLELVILPHAALWLRVVVHALAIYGLIWLVGLYASLRARPHRLVEDRLVLHRGMLRSLEVSLADIVSIDRLPSFADDWKKRKYCRGALRLDVAGPTVLELRTPARVLVSVDDPEAFIARVAPPPASE